MTNCVPANLDHVTALLQHEAMPTPTLYMRRSTIREKAREIGSGVPGMGIFYAVKANDSVEVVRTIAEAGLGFEVGSAQELDTLLGLGVDVSRIISSNPVKSPEFIANAYGRGVRTFTFDSIAEVDKLVAGAPNGHAVLRLAVPNEGSEWPLSGKFGAEFSTAVDLLEYAKHKGLEAVGVNFHVGSPCPRRTSWAGAIGLAAKLFDEARALGFEFRLLNLGGGYPSHYLKPVPGPAEIEKVIGEAVHHWFPRGVQLVIEPGRYLVGEAGVFVTRCIGKAQRQDGLWVMIDVGVFNGMAEAIGGIRYPYRTLREGTPTQIILSGPSCDGFDVIDRAAELVEPEVGDYVLIGTAGAYTTVYAARFNGFPLPEVRVED